MGDRRRSEIFAEFVTRNFPRARSVLVVGDGKDCRVSHLLARQGVKAVAVDPNSRNAHKGLVGLSRRSFQRSDPIAADLIIGMHPDAATPEIVAAAQAQGKPFAVVPCCFMGPESTGIRNIGEWIERLQRMTEDSGLHQLKMRGRNVVIFRK